MQRKNTHVLTEERRLAEWFVKGTACDTYTHTTVLQTFSRSISFLGLVGSIS
jgi:hypothetical protein